MEITKSSNCKTPIRKAKDGATNETIYNNEPIKILWVLREPNGEQPDYLEYLKNPKVYPDWQKSFGLVVKASHAILNGICEADKIPNADSIVSITQRIAIINIKKTGGGSRINPYELNEAAKENWENTKAQIIGIAPDLIMLAGSTSYIPNDFIKNINYFIGKQTKVIHCYHPNQRRIKHKVYLERILTDFYGNLAGKTL